MKSDANLGFLYSLTVFGFGFIGSWKRWLLPALSDTVDKMIARKDVPLRTAENFDDIGHFLQRLSSDLMEARVAIGLPVTHEPRPKKAAKPKVATTKRRRPTLSETSVQG